MRRNSIPFHGHAVLAAVMIFSGSCIANNATAEVLTSELEPARLVTLSGAEAKEYYDSYQLAVRVLTATAAERLVAVAFDEDLPAIFSPDIPPGCVDEGGVICCDPATGTLFLSATYGNQLGWVHTGELCEAPRAADGVAFVPVSEEVSRALSANFGVDGCFMLLAEADGTPRVLVNAPSQDSWRWSYCFNELAELEGSSKILAGVTLERSEFWLGLPGGQRSLLRASSAVILANHHGRPPPPNVILYDPPFCNKSGTRYRRCHKRSRHLFYKDLTVSFPRWTAMWKCQCP